MLKFRKDDHRMCECGHTKKEHRDPHVSSDGSQCLHMGCTDECIEFREVIQRRTREYVGTNHVPVV